MLQTDADSLERLHPSDNDRISCSGDTHGEEDEELLVVSPHTVVHPGTVMVHFLYTPSTHAATTQLKFQRLFFQAKPLAVQN